MRTKLAFIGVGNMATATLTGITSGENAFVAWSDIVLYDTQKEKLEKIATLGAKIADSVKDAVESADCILLCVKPQNFSEILPSISECDGVKDKLFITIAAGITMDTVSKAALGAPVVRVMPNTPMLIGKGVCALCRNADVSDADFDFACGIFASSARILKITEDEMNRIISVTSSSPAYVFAFIKSILDGAKAQGLLESISEKEMLDCICDMIIGSCELMKRGGKTPEEQIATVTSKGGTTERAMAELASRGFSEIIISAMQKCTDRADELSKL